LWKWADLTSLEYEKAKTLLCTGVDQSFGAAGVVGDMGASGSEMGDGAEAELAFGGKGPGGYFEVQPGFGVAAAEGEEGGFSVVRRPAVALTSRNESVPAIGVFVERDGAATVH
jgi:hypothetical protein